VMRHFKPHTLTEPEEKIVNLKNTTGVSALHNLYDAITNRYVFRLAVDGEEKELTRGELMVYVRGHDPELRAKAYQELYRVYGQDGPVLGLIYQTLVRDWSNEQVDLRHYPNPIAARNLANDIPDDVVSTLLEVCERNAPLFQRYFRLKARLLGLERLRRFDVYAPIARSDKRYDFAAAAEVVLDSFGRFDPQLAGLARRVFDDRHLDSEVRKGKRGGAFCATVTPELSPWVLVNYQGRPDDVATLAHELGHAIHSLLAAGHSLFTQQSSLPLAETASTFGEMMLIERLLQQEDDESVRRDLLFRQVDDAYATILRQSFFALFERQAHQMIKDGASVDELSAAYLKNLQTQFGDAVEVSDEFRWEWVSIPHIYQVPFYVYAYTFGQLLVLSLYQQYQAEGEAFKPRYLKILAAGGSEAPVKILSEAGIDVHQAAFWQGGFDVIRRMIEQLEALPAA
jgi:oligoendopeptidase F